MALPLLFSLLGGGLAKAGVLGAAGSLLASPLVASAIGSGLGTLAETGDIKKGLASGLGSFAGGSLLGAFGGAGAGAAGAGAAGAEAAAAAAAAGAPAAATAAGALPPVVVPGAQAPGLFGNMGNIAREGMAFGKSMEGIGSMVGGTLGASMFGDRAKPKPGQGGTPDLSAMRAMEREVRMPGPDFIPGQSGEFDYGVSTPYTSDYMARYTPQDMSMGGMVANPYAQQYASQRQQMGMAMGGQVQREIRGYGPVAMQAGGIAEIGAAGPPAAAPNEREVIAAAIAAVKGQHPQPEAALGAFLAQYGEEAFRDLVDRVQSGEFGDTQERFADGENGEVRGPGDGTGVDDMIPAVVDGEGDVLLSDGEFVLRKDATDALNQAFGEDFTNKVNNAGPRAPEVVKQLAAA